MRERNRLAIFFIICAVVFIIGLVCAVAGIVTGGPKDIDKLADKYDWIQGSPGERYVVSQKEENFDSIEVTGDADLWIVSKEYYNDADWLAAQELLEQTELSDVGENKVCVVTGDRLGEPKVTVENGVLTIDSGTMDHSGMNLNIMGETWSPKVLVCMPDEELKSLKVSGQVSDVKLLGISWKAADIGLNTGDIYMKNIDSGSLTAEVDSGDIDLTGKFKGKTKLTAETGDIQISGKIAGTSAVSTDTGDVDMSGKLTGITNVSTNTGDIQIKTQLIKEKYSYDLKTSTGDVKVIENGKEIAGSDDANTASENGGPNKITAAADTGDIVLDFAGK